MNDTSTVRLHAQHPMPPYNLPTAAVEALDTATRQARAVSFVESPCGAEESMVVTSRFEFRY